MHGKGGKKRYVPVTDQLVIDAIIGADEWLFPSPRGGHLTPNHVSKLMAKALPGKWTAHTLRHRFGTIAYAGTGDLLAVSKLLGHASTVTTQTYVEMPMQNALRAVDAASDQSQNTNRGGSILI